MMKLTDASLAAAMVGVLAAGGACRQASPPEPPPGQAQPEQSAPGANRIDVSKLGPQVGDRVPDFSLPDQSGRTRTLESLMGSRGLMLVFFRSADW